MLELLLAPIAAISLCLYLSFTFFNLAPLPLALSFVIPILIALYLARPYLHFPKKPIQHLLPLSLVLFFLLALAFILSPLIFTQTLDQTTFLRFPGIGDYYKHVYTIVGIITKGLPPLNPYFPGSSMGYYYGYYLIPAAISSFFSLSPSLVLFYWVLFTTAIFLISFYLLTLKYFKHSLHRLLALAALIFGLGLDIWPLLFSQPNSTAHIEVWSQFYKLEFVVNNTYTALIWVPQHVLASIFALAIVHQLLSKKPNLIFLSLAFPFIFLTSIYVSLPLVLFTFLYFIFYSRFRRQLIFLGLYSFLLLLPYLSQLTQRGSTLGFYHYQPFPFFTHSFSFYLNTLLSLVFDYGFIFLLFPFFFFLPHRKIPLRLSLIFFTIYTFFFFIIFFLRSYAFNDFAMRSQLPLQIGFLILFFLFLTCLKLKLHRRLLLLLFTLNLLFSSPGFFYEIYHRWQDRLLLDPYTTQLNLALRTYPPQTIFAAIDRQDWVSYIPTLGFHPVISPSLYDAGVYFSGPEGERHGQFEQLGINLFNRTTMASDSASLIQTQDQLFSKLHQYFSYYPFDYLILDSRVWVKQGVNPWLIVFQQLNLPLTQITPVYRLISQSDLLKALSHTQISLNQSQAKTLKITDHQLPLPQGLWFLSSCDTKNGVNLKLEFTDHYGLFDQSSTSNLHCFGHLFYQPDNSPLDIANSSTVTTVVAYPLSIIEK